MLNMLLFIQVREGGGHNMSQSTFLNMERAAEFNNSVPKNINKFLQNVVN